MNKAIGVGTAIAPYLDDDERVVWTGQPQRGIIVTIEDWILSGFGLLWTAAVVAMVLADNGDSKVPWPFQDGMLFIGLYVAFGRFIADAWRRARIVYALTDRRAIIIAGRRPGSVRSLDLRRIVEFGLTEHASGRGWVFFGAESEQRVFERIENPKAVFDLARRL